MRSRPVDHSLWLAVGHAASASSTLSIGGTLPSDYLSACQDLLTRALDAGADPDSEFSLPGDKHSWLNLTCMERAFGQLDGLFLVPFLERAIELHWKPALVLPSGLWQTGSRTHGSTGLTVRPSNWRLMTMPSLEQEPGWLQLVSQGMSWGGGRVSARLCQLLLDAGAPLLRPAQALRDGAEHGEGRLAYGELNDPLRLSIERGGSLEVAKVLVEAGASDLLTTDALRFVCREIEINWEGHPDEANTLISLIKSHVQAKALENDTLAASPIAAASPRRNL